MTKNPTFDNFVLWNLFPIQPESNEEVGRGFAFAFRYFKKILTIHKDDVDYGRFNNNLDEVLMEHIDALKTYKVEEDNPIEVGRYMSLLRPENHRGRANTVIGWREDIEEVILEKDPKCSYHYVDDFPISETFPRKTVVVGYKGKDFDGGSVVCPRLKENGELQSFDFVNFVGYDAFIKKIELL